LPCPAVAVRIPGMDGGRRNLETEPNVANNPGGKRNEKHH
jgi:hypothetical protein